jgi:hypothetical protein
VTYHNGALIDRFHFGSPVVKALFWGDKWKTDVDHATLSLALFGFFSGIGAQIKGLLSEYVTIDGVTWGGDAYYQNTFTVPTGGASGTLVPSLKPSMVDSDITYFLSAVVFQGLAPGANSIPENLIYFVFLPAGITVTDQDGKTTCVGVGQPGVNICGYHHYFWYDITHFPPVQGNVWYAVIPYGPCSACMNFLGTGKVYDACTYWCSHELYEVITDPHSDGYYDDHLGEIADICDNGQFVVYDTTYRAKVWSQSKGQCI